MLFSYSVSPEAGSTRSYAYDSINSCGPKVSFAYMQPRPRINASCHCGIALKRLLNAEFRKGSLMASYCFPEPRPRPLTMPSQGHAGKSLESFKIYLHAPTQGCLATDQRIESVGLFLASFAETMGIERTSGTVEETDKYWKSKSLRDNSHLT